MHKAITMNMKQGTEIKSKMCRSSFFLLYIAVIVAIAIAIAIANNKKMLSVFKIMQNGAIANEGNEINAQLQYL